MRDALGEEEEGFGVWKECFLTLLGLDFHIYIAFRIENKIKFQAVNLSLCQALLGSYVGEAFHLGE